MSDFARSHARSTDPATSHVAARSAEPVATSHKAKILEALSQLGSGTQTDIAAATGLLPHQVNKRLSDLHRDELIAPTGATRRGHAGRDERVWSLPDCEQRALF